LIRSEAKTLGFFDQLRLVYKAALETAAANRLKSGIALKQKSWLWVGMNVARA
jgi:hypothetical protein